MSSSKVSQLIKSFQAFLKGMLQSKEITLNLTQRIEIMLFYVNRYPLDCDKMEVFSNNSSSNDFLENFIKENSLDVLIFSVKEILSQKAVNQKTQPIQTDLQSPKIEIQLSQNEQVIKDYIKNMISSKDQRQNQNQIQLEQNMDFGGIQNQIQSPLIIENKSQQNILQDEFSDEIDSLNNRYNASSQGSQKILNDQANINNNYLASSENLQKNYLKSASTSQNMLKSNDPSFNQLDIVLNDTKNKQNETATQNYSMNKCSSQAVLTNQINMNQNEKYQINQQDQQENVIGQFLQNQNQIGNNFIQEFQKNDMNQIQVNSNANYFESLPIMNQTNIGDTIAINNNQNGHSQYNYLQYIQSFQQNKIENQEEYKKSLNHLLQDVKSNLKIMKNHTIQYNNLIQEYHDKNDQQKVQKKQDLAGKYQYNFKSPGQIEDNNQDFNQQMKKSLKNVILYTRRDSIKASFYSIESDLQKKLQQTKHYLKHNNEKRSYINADENKSNQRGQQIESLSQRYMLNRQKNNNSPQNTNQNNTNQLGNSNIPQQQRIDQQDIQGINNQPQMNFNQFQQNQSSQPIENQEFNQYLANSPQQRHIFNQVQQQPNSNNQIQQPIQIQKQSDDQVLNFAKRNEANFVVNYQSILPINTLNTSQQQQQNGFIQSQGQSLQIPQIQQKLINLQQPQIQNQELQKNEFNYQYQQATQQQLLPVIYQQQPFQNQEQQIDTKNYYDTQQFIPPQIMQSPVIYQEQYIQKPEQLKNEFKSQQIQQLQVPQIQQQTLSYQLQQLQDLQYSQKNEMNNYQTQQFIVPQILQQPAIYQQQVQNQEQLYDSSQNQNQEIILQQQQQSPVQIQQQQNILQQMQLQQTKDQKQLPPLINNQRRFQTEIHRNPGKNLFDNKQNSFIENIFDNNQNQLNTAPLEIANHQKNITESEKTNQINDQQLQSMLKKYDQNQISKQRYLGNSHSPGKQLQNIYSLENVLQQTTQKNNNQNAVTILQQNQQINSQNEQFTEKNKLYIEDQQIY
ncbi:hypothetical protein ABPG74_015247 [Tetrahymena malaccensis]